MVLFIASQIKGQKWEETPLHEMYERAISLTDPYGEKSYSGEETSYKGDNNVFRSTWWAICIDETMRTNPWFGLGWGYDLAEAFVRVYYPEGGDDFAARSPHNIFITVFARTGITGLVPFLFSWPFSESTCGAQSDRDRNFGIWCIACTILTSACFGVVLEGPMGAVLFWTVLGLANSSAGGGEPDENASGRTDAANDWPVAKAAAFDIPSKTE